MSNPSYTAWPSLNATWTFGHTFGATFSDTGKWYIAALAAGDTAPTGPEVKGTSSNPGIIERQSNTSIVASTPVELTFQTLAANTAYDYYFLLDNSINQQKDFRSILNQTTKEDRPKHTLKFSYGNAVPTGNWNVVNAPYPNAIVDSGITSEISKSQTISVVTALTTATGFLWGLPQEFWDDASAPSFITSIGRNLGFTNIPVTPVAPTYTITIAAYRGQTRSVNITVDGVTKTYEDVTGGSQNAPLIFTGTVNSLTREIEILVDTTSDYINGVILELDYSQPAMLVEVLDVDIKEGATGSYNVDNHFLPTIAPTYSILPALPSGVTLSSAGLLSWDGTQVKTDRALYTITCTDGSNPITEDISLVVFNNIPFDKMVYVNIGSDTVSGNFNNISTLTSGTKIADCIDGTGALTGIGIEFLSALTSFDTNTAVLESHQGIDKEFFRSSGVGAITIRLSGLTIGDDFSLQLAGYNNDTLSTIYTVGASSVTYTSLARNVPAKFQVIEGTLTATTLDIVISGTANRINGFIYSANKVISVDQTRASEKSTFTTSGDATDYLSTTYAGLALASQTKEAANKFSAVLPADGFQLGVNHDYAFTLSSVPVDTSDLFLGGDTGDLWDTSSDSLVFTSTNPNIVNTIKGERGSADLTSPLRDIFYKNSGVTSDPQISGQVFSTTGITIDPSISGFASFIVFSYTGTPYLNTGDTEVNLMWLNNHLAPQVFFENGSNTLVYDTTGNAADRKTMTFPANDGLPHVIGMDFDTATGKIRCFFDGQVLFDFTPVGTLPTMSDIAYITGIRQRIEQYFFKAFFRNRPVQSNELETITKWGLQGLYKNGVRF